MSIIQFPDRIERIKAAIAARWRREIVLAGMMVPEAKMERALDLLVPAALSYLEMTEISTDARHGA